MDNVIEISKIVVKINYHDAMSNPTIVIFKTPFIMSATIYHLEFSN